MIKKFARTQRKSSNTNTYSIKVQVLGFRHLFQFISSSLIQLLNIWISLTLFKHMRRVHSQEFLVTNPLTSAVNTGKLFSSLSPYSSLRFINNSYFDQQTKGNSQINVTFLQDQYNKSYLSELPNQMGKPRNDVILNLNEYKLEKIILGKNYVGNIKEKPDFKGKFELYGNEYSSQRKPKLTSSLRYGNTESSHKFMNEEDRQKLLHLVMNGLGLQNLPDVKKVNISQAEYANKYKEYLRRINNRKKSDGYHKIMQNSSKAILSEMQMISFSSLKSTSSNPFRERSKKRRKREFASKLKTRSDTKTNFKRNKKSTAHLHFSLERLKMDNKSLRIEDIEEANLRLLLIYNSVLTKRPKNNPKIEKHCNTAEKRNNNNKINYSLRLKVFQRQKGKRLWIDRKNIEISVEKTKLDNTQSQWVDFNVLRAVQTWLKGSQRNFDLELQCDNCVKAGARIISDFAYNNNNSYPAYKEELLVPVINIVMRSGKEEKIQNEKPLDDRRYNLNATENNSTLFPNSCPNTNSKHPRCCRHSMQVVFSQIKGFEFIIQPKTFDAGYCFGRCPLRFNPANHHAMLQSLIWKQSDGLHAPRPCCAPSKLVELEVLHLDEKNSNKLKISTWNDMRVVECACS